MSTPRSNPPAPHLPKPSDVRFKVEPGDVPPEKAARRLHLTAAQFADMLPALLARGFPHPDPTTGNFDLEAIDVWRHRRHAGLFGLTPPPLPAEPQRSAEERAEAYRAAKKRGGNG